MRHDSNLDFRISARFGSVLTPLGSRSKRLGAYFFLKLLMPHAGNLDFQISARFGSWLIPFDPGVRPPE